MVIFVGTNIIVDALMQREPYFEDAQFIMTKCAEQEITGYLAAQSIPNLFYILRKAYSQEERRKFIRNLCSIFNISELNADKILSAVENDGFSDFEDCLQEECAVDVSADYFVTRNLDDYKKARVEVIKPGESVKLLQE